MPRGRTRKSAPNLPPHIDTARLPKGIYWDASGMGRWYVFELEADGRKRRRTVAGAAARMGDLHAIADQRTAADDAGTLAHLIRMLEASEEWRTLGARTRTDYAMYGQQICAYRLGDGSQLGDMQVHRITPPAIRRLISAIAMGWPESRPGAGNAVPGYPTKANHWLRYLRRLFRWGREFGHCSENPAQGIKGVREKADPRMPELQAFRRVQAFARLRGALGAREKGSVPPYLWAAMEIAYQCRLRGIEVITLTDAHDLGDTLRTNRRKGSRDNQVRKGDQLEAALEHLRDYRQKVWDRRRTPTPLRPDARPIFVGEDGAMLTRRAWDNGWGRLMRMAVDEGVITAEQRFGLHGLKHRGATDTAGTYEVKKQATGHKTDAMVHLYDHDVPTVEPAGGG